MSELAKVIGEHGQDVALGAAGLYAIGSTAMAGIRAFLFQSPAALEKLNTFSPEQAAELHGIGDGVAQYIQENSISAIALVDTSARPLHIPIRRAIAEQSEATSASENKLGVYFVNPLGFRPKVRLGWGVYSTLTKELIHHGSLLSPAKRRATTEIIDAIPKELPGLYAHRDESVLVFDTCYHTGTSLRSIAAALKVAGFADIHTGVVHYDPTNKNDTYVPDLVLTEKMPSRGCYPAGYDKTSKKTYDSVRSIARRDAKYQALNRNLRSNVHAAIDAAKEAATIEHSSDNKKQ